MFQYSSLMIQLIILFNKITILIMLTLPDTEDSIFNLDDLVGV